MDINLLKDIAGVPLSCSRMETLNNPELWVFTEDRQEKRPK
jgi:hypothetical protein